ncbi:MAG: hypothetical protein MUD01_02870 [Chloroflexaceae bacterium]|jgi:hypothetical protein|nr:hypothetical protein [Chloroflexaceae bacterium]
MPVIINEFEILPAEAPPANGQPPPEQQPPQLPALNPADVERLTRFIEQRRARLRAD